MDTIGDLIPNSAKAASASKSKFQSDSGINISEGQFGNLNSIIAELLKKNPFQL